MSMPDDIKVTSEVLWKGALFFALIDILLITVLIRFIKPKDLYMMKWKLIIFMAVFFCILFGSIVSLIFWDSVYSYVFPSWLRWIIPPLYGILFSLVGLFFWWLAFKLRSNQVLIFCILGGLWGFTTHILAIYRGILEKPPMLQGTSSISALTVATFEFIFYWSICVGFTYIIENLGIRLFRREKKKA